MIRLASQTNFRQIEEEWRYEFTIYVLSNLGLPEELLTDCFPENLSDYSTSHKLQARNLLSQFDVKIIDDRDGGLKIYVGDQIVAEWKKCSFVRKEDISAKDPSDRLYIEIKADPWTIFKEENDG